MEVVVQLFNFLELAFPFFNNTGSHLLIFAAYNRLSLICYPRVLPGDASWFHFSSSLSKEAGYCLLHILTSTRNSWLATLGSPVTENKIRM